MWWTLLEARFLEPQHQQNSIMACSSIALMTLFVLIAVRKAKHLKISKTNLKNQTHSSSPSPTHNFRCFTAACCTTWHCHAVLLALHPLVALMQLLPCHPWKHWRWKHAFPASWMILLCTMLHTHFVQFLVCTGLLKDPWASVSDTDPPPPVAHNQQQH